jgi:hypothetical protein
MHLIGAKLKNIDEKLSVSILFCDCYPIFAFPFLLSSTNSSKKGPLFCWHKTFEKRQYLR